MRRPFSTLYVPPYFTLTNIFFPELRYQENKKATPSDTLSVSLKISRLVWLYGGRYKTRTCDLPHVKPKNEIFSNFLVLYSHIRFILFSFRHSFDT